ncbi:hypothetical protein CCR75_005005 [Bremia lactucae]|uniref:Uncharacterized protein n=1 Tax=Bremia lactucae TaxID=4779 RepID=A0A976FQW5_BRELC|nr:hypothetical protein CCR75_005005 [Bremia lactucae]
MPFSQDGSASFRLLDGLVVPYILLQSAYVGVVVVPFLTSGTSKLLHIKQSKRAPGLKEDGSAHPVLKAYIMVRSIAMH